MSLDVVSLQIKTFGKTFANYTSFLRIFETKFDFFSIGAGEGGLGGGRRIFFLRATLGRVHTNTDMFENRDFFLHY